MDGRNVYLVTNISLGVQDQRQNLQKPAQNEHMRPFGQNILGI